MTEVVNIEKATEEVTAWLDRKKIPMSRRVDSQSIIDNLIEAVQYGYISISEDGKIKQTLQFPLEDSQKVVFLSELQYNNRSNTDAVLKIVGSMRVQTAESNILARIAELTNQPMGYVMKFDSVDMIIAKSIGVFFTS